MGFDTLLHVFICLLIYLFTCLLIISIFLVFFFVFIFKFELFYIHPCGAYRGALIEYL